eukprot:Gb_37088 [translate_table: standard]
MYQILWKGNGRPEKCFEILCHNEGSNPNTVRGAPVLIWSIFLGEAAEQNISSVLELNSVATPAKSKILVSPKGTFAYGFLSIGAQAYVLGIWYATIPNYTVTWLANRDHPVDGNSALTLAENGSMTLSYSNGTLVWATNTSDLRVKEAILLENGVAVPEQYWVDLDSLDQTQYVMTGGGAGLIISSAGINTTGGIIISDGLSFMTSDFGEGHLRRLTLDADGNLRVYGWQKNTSKWVVVWKAIQQQCKIYGMCGPNALCADKSDHTQECICPPGFHMKNDSDHSQGCDRDIDLKCNESASKFVNLEFASYQGHDLLRLSFQTLKDCETACLDNCSCLAFSYMYDQYPWKALGSENCYLKGRLLYGYRSPNSKSFMFIRVSVNDTNSSAAIASISRLTNPSLNLVCPSDLRLKFPKITYSSQEVTTASAVGSSILLVEIIAGATAAYFLMSKYRILKEAERYGKEMLSGRPKKFTYAELETATNNFSQIVGKGGFGTVYKGFLPDFTPIAVKKIDRVTEGEDEFWAEVTIVCRIHHLNLVRMFGFCAEGDHRLLVYEYVPNGSLETHLFPSPDKVLNPPSLDWKTRYKIAVRTAKGIAYLHEECLEWILHCDIKPQNILLDDKFCPKVSDFGLSKLVDRETALSVSHIRGSRGYLAPEWTENRPITAKADVYSFGLVLLEIVSGRKNFAFTVSAMETDRWCFPVWAFEMMKRGEMSEIVDQNMGEHEWDEDEVERVIKTAFWCIQTDPLLRPSMGKAVHMLEGTVPVEEPVDLNFFSFLNDDLQSASAAKDHHISNPPHA